MTKYPLISQVDAEFFVVTGGGAPRRFEDSEALSCSGLGLHQEAGGRELHLPGISFFTLGPETREGFSIERIVAACQMLELAHPVQHLPGRHQIVSGQAIEDLQTNGIWLVGGVEQFELSVLPDEM